jgi:hypothetical protein
MVGIPALQLGGPFLESQVKVIYCDLHFVTLLNIFRQMLGHYLKQNIR